MAYGKKSLRESISEEARSFFSEVKKFGREAEGLAVRSSEKIAHVSQVGKLKGEIILLEQKRKRKVAELGGKLIESKDINAITDAGLLKILEEISELDTQIKSCEGRIENLKQNVRG